MRRHQPGLREPLCWFVLTAFDCISVSSGLLCCVLTVVIISGFLLTISLLKDVVQNYLYKAMNGLAACSLLCRAQGHALASHLEFCPSSPGFFFLGAITP